MRLIPLLEKYKGKNGVVLAIPRGGVPIGYYIAKALGFYLDLALTKKIGHPLNKELAIGAVSLEDMVVDEEFKVDATYIDQETDRIRQGLRERYANFMGDRQPADLKGKVVIIVDDGAATGATILASLEMVRRSHPVKLIVAVPVSSREAAVRISKLADEFICPWVPERLIAVGMHYEDFSEVDDEDVTELLKESS